MSLVVSPWMSDSFFLQLSLAIHKCVFLCCVYPHLEELGWMRKHFALLPCQNMSGEMLRLSAAVQNPELCVFIYSSWNYPAACSTATGQVRGQGSERSSSDTVCVRMHGQQRQPGRFSDNLESFLANTTSSQWGYSNHHTITHTSG